LTLQTDSAELTGVFSFLQMTLPLNKFDPPWFMLWVKKHCCQQSAFFVTMLPLRCAKYTVPSDDLRSEISSRALPTFQNIGKVRKQEAI